ncbi:Malate dehydrogenase, cytoplasmic [Clydaea vesicula]|uniref:Malate dehydrogenase n=1 Tax=Clydaea vesicula TaxID=447962 RepID=A0AAD5U3E6_9FUNG|nr:Malate dehydrogenase, cytoplasmic [Clydaea vesicula]KAJ3390313.1 Malate dehydrogenase, cytoplasmic [Lobulomyces angularis]
MKLNPHVTKLALFDIVNTPGVAADLSHINTPAKVTGHKGADQLGDALTGADIVIIPAGVPRKPGMTRDDLFNTNANIVKTLAEGAAKHSPKAFVCVIANPVNSTVPIVAEVFKKHNVFDPKRLFGVTTLDVVRASTFVTDIKGGDPARNKVTVVGGHSGVTILPLLSQTEHKFTQEELEALTKRIQFGGDEVVKAKDGLGSATLSMAQAGARFANALIKACKGDKTVVEPTYVKSDVVPGLEYFASNVELSEEGVGKIHPLGTLSQYEQKLLEAAIPELKSNIAKGVNFVKGN